jgi:hypothetical protein
MDQGNLVASAIYLFREGEGDFFAELDKNSGNKEQRQKQRTLAHGENKDRPADRLHLTNQHSVPECLSCHAEARLQQGLCLALPPAPDPARRTGQPAIIRRLHSTLSSPHPPQRQPRPSPALARADQQPDPSTYQSMHKYESVCIHGIERFLVILIVPLGIQPYLSPSTPAMSCALSWITF